jgi:peptidoglycan/xylan/chitin deacetylase (PgdA/CDA1 family)
MRRAAVSSGRCWGTRLAPFVFTAVLLAPKGSVRAETIVSITFDDTIGNQYAAREVLGPRGMRATFYVDSPRLGRTGYLSLAQLAALQADGHEVGGHTLSHVDLTTLSPDQQRREICDDRAALLVRLSITYQGQIPDTELRVAVARTRTLA